MLTRLFQEAEGVDMEVEMVVTTMVMGEEMVRFDFSVGQMTAGRAIT